MALEGDPRGRRAAPAGGLPLRHSDASAEAREWLHVEHLRQRGDGESASVGIPNNRASPDAVRFTPAEVVALIGDDWAQLVEPLVSSTSTNAAEFDGSNGSLSYQPFVIGRDGALMIAVPSMVLAAITRHARRDPRSIVTMQATRLSCDGVSLPQEAATGNDSRPVWVAFWAPGCPSCVIEMGMMETMYQERRAAGLEVVGIALSGSLVDAAAFGQAVGITYPLGVDLSAAIDYEVVVLPTHFWIDRDGIVRAWASGDAPPDLFEEKLARIVGSGQ